MRVLKLTLIEVKSLQEQGRRSFEWQPDGNFVNDVTEIVLSNKLRPSMDSFLPISSEALSISSSVDDVTVPGILNDWDEARFRFILEVEIEAISRHTSRGIRAIVRGYTDHADLTHNDLVDPDTKMYINSVVTVQDINNGPRGMLTRTIDSSQTVLADFRDNSFMIRPSDVFARIENERELSSEDIDLDELVDTRSSFHGGVMINKRQHNTSSNYIHTLVTSDIEAKRNLDTRATSLIDDNLDTLAYETAGGTANTYRSNRFLRALADDKNIDYRRKNYFTYADLEEFNDDGAAALDHVTVVYHPEDYGIYESESLFGASAEVKSAAQICHAIPAIMDDCNFDTIVFEMTNESPRRRGTHFALIDCTSTLGEHYQPTSEIHAFETRFKREVFELITNHDHMAVTIEVDAEIAGVIMVTINIDGPDVVKFTFAAFADALISPNVSNNSRSADGLANGYLSIRQNIQEVMDRHQKIDLSTDILSASRSRHGRESVSKPRSNQSLLDDSILR